MPKGLIPLMLSGPNSTSSLSPMSRSSAMLRSPTRASYSYAPPVSTAHKRNQSDGMPMIRPSRPPIRSSMKRQSQQLPASLPQIPYNAAEWKRAISEIKRYHVTRRYRACSARCNEILTNIKNISVVEPAYLIYLHFYAASSLEMCARPLAPASAYRISLLQQARVHYERAAALLAAAEDTAMLRQRSNSAASSVPSLHSPSGSLSSRAWTPESGLTTPTTTTSTTTTITTASTTSTLSRKSSLTFGGGSSSSSSSACPSKPAKKKVSFELPRDRSRWSFTLPANHHEPAIRPDSPTLGGFDDEYFAAGAMRQQLPELPPPTPTSKRLSRGPDHPDAAAAAAAACCPAAALAQLQQQPLPPATHPMPSISERDEVPPTASPLPLPSPSTAAAADDDDDDDDDEDDGDGYPFFAFPTPARYTLPRPEDAEAARALSRYCETLAALKVQVARHTAALDDVLGEDLRLQQAQAQAPPGLQRTGSLREQHCGGSGAGRRQSQRGSVAVVVVAAGGGNVGSGSGSGVAAVGTPSSRSGSALGLSRLGEEGEGAGEEEEEEQEEEELVRERKARIDRLKMSGWRRKRFDASRYEDLCHAVMAELNHD